MDESTILVTGATGQVGTAFRFVMPEAMFLDRAQLDLSKPGLVHAAVVERGPSAVINCAAYTNVDRAEAGESLATVVNGKSVGALAEACTELGIPFLTFSTDYVFDGSSGIGYVESDPVAPINAYGRSKLVGENLVLGMGGQGLVVRTSWVVSDTHDNFVSTMLKLAANSSNPLRVVDDQRGRPTVAADLALASWTALQAGITGVLHLANHGETTWFDLASRTIELSGMARGGIERCATDEYPRSAPRPMNSVLNTERGDEGGVVELPAWEESLVSLVDRQMGRLGLAS